MNPTKDAGDHDDSIDGFARHMRDALVDRPRREAAHMLRGAGMAGGAQRPGRVTVRTGFRGSDIHGG